MKQLLTILTITTIFFSCNGGGKDELPLSSDKLSFGTVLMSDSTRSMQVVRISVNVGAKLVDSVKKKYKFSPDSLCWVRLLKPRLDSLKNPIIDSVTKTAKIDTGWLSVPCRIINLDIAHRDPDSLLRKN